jgi:hypothetical protein
MFSKGVVHECFKKLLVNVTAIGKRLDRREARTQMDVYSRMKWLARGNMSLRRQFAQQVDGYSLIH